MTIELTARHINLSPEDRAYAEDKLRKLGRLVDSLDMHVTIEAEKHRQTCAISAWGKGASYSVEVTDDDLKAAVNEAVDILARQLRKDKTSRLAGRREGAETIRRPKKAGA